MRTRFRTYAVAIPEELEPYAKALDAHPAVQELERVGRAAQRIAAYDEYLRSVGGDPTPRETSKDSFDDGNPVTDQPARAPAPRGGAPTITGLAAIQ